MSLQTLDFAITCDEVELETYDVKQDGPNSITAFVASEAGKVSVPVIPSVSTTRPTVEISDSKSRIITTCWTLTFRFTCISMGSAFVSLMYELDSRVKP